MLSVLLPLAGIAAPLEDNFLRTGVFSAAAMPLEPVIDGEVSLKEYFGANRYSGLINSVQQPGTALRETVTWYAGYTDEAFFLAFQVQRPKGAPPPSAKTGGEGKFYPQQVFSDDCLEAMFDIGREAFVLALNAKGDHSAYRIRPNDRYKYSPSIRYRARVTADGWEGELRLGFADFGLKTPAPGDNWRFDLILNEKTPFDRTAGVTGITDMNQWMNPARFATLKFAAGNAPVVQMLRAGNTRNSGGVDLRILPGENTAAVQLELYRAKSPVHYFEITDGERRENAALTPNAAAQIVLNNFYDRLASKSGSAAPGTAPVRFEIYRKLQPGNYLAAWQVTEDGAGILAAGVLPFTAEPPITAETRPHYLSDERCEIDIDLQGMDENHADVSAGFIVDGKTVARTSARIERKGTLTLSTASIPPDSPYTLEVTLNGDTANSLRIPMHRPSPPLWLGNNLGKSRRVPSPWVPVRRNGQSAEVSERRYNFHDSFLPEQITATDAELFAAPPSITAIFQDGSAVELNRGQNRFTAEDGNALERDFQTACGTLRGHSKLEYDGFLWNDFTFDPGSRKNLRSLKIEIPLKREHAQFFNHTYPGTEPFRFRMHGDWDRLKDGMHRLKFSYGLWLGGYERGLTLAFESDRNTDGGDREGFIELDAKANTTVLRINLVAQERTVDAPLNFSFGLQATPVKPATRRTWFDQFCNFNASRPWDDERKFTAWNELVSGTAKNMSCNWGSLWSNGGTFFGHPNPPAGIKKNLTRAAAARLKEGVSPVYYSGWAANSGAPELTPYLYDLVRMPLGNWMGGWGDNLYKQCPKSQWADMFLYYTGQLADECGIRGVYMDQTTELSSCINSHHGCGYTAPDGTVRPTFPVRAMREFHKRLYLMFDEKFGPDGFMIYSHNSSQPIFTPVDAFISRRCYAETFAHKPTNLSEVFAFDRIAAGYNPTATGIASEITWWNGFHPTISNNNAMAVVALFGGGIKGVVMHYLNQGASRYGFNATFREGYGHDEHAELALARTRLLIPDAEFIPFFHSASRVSPADKRLKAALYLGGKQALVIVSNVFDNGPVTSTIVLNLPFRVNRTTDPLSGKPVDLQQISINNNSYFLILAEE